MCLLLSFGLVICSCKSEERIEEISVPCMGIGYIYTGDSVLYYLNHQTDESIKLSKSYWNKARKHEKTDISKTIRCYKRAIALNPQKEIYMEYLAFLEQQKNYVELDRIYDLLTITQNINDQFSYVFGPPSKEIYLSSIINLLNQGKNLNYHDLHPDEDLQITAADFREALENDIRLVSDRDSREFKQILLNLMEEKELEAYMNSEEVKELFLKSFKSAGPSYEVTKSNINAFDYPEDSEGDGFLDFNNVFAKFLPANLGLSNKFELNHVMLNSDALYYAIIYSLDSSALGCPAEMRHITYYLSYLDKENFTPIKTIPIAWQSGEELVTCNLEDRNLKRVSYKRVWAEPYQKSQKGNRLITTIEDKVEDRFLDNIWIDSPDSISTFPIKKYNK